MSRKIVGVTVGTPLSPQVIIDKAKDIVDDVLSTTSTNPVQNKVITGEVNEMKSQLQDVETTIGNIDVLLGTI